MSKKRPNTREIEYWWIMRNGSMIIAEIYRYGDVLEAVVTGTGESFRIKERDLILEVKKPTVFVLQ
jgi:hypothetical protein